MQKLAEICVHRPVFASMLIAAITVVGGVSFFTLGVDRYPRVETPVVSVTTTNPGATPENIETEITDRIEAAVNTVSGIDELRSTSTEGRSRVTISFDLSKNADIAAQEVRAKVDPVMRDLPETADPPVVQKQDPDSFPILMFSVSAPMPVVELTTFIEQNVQKRLESVNGVGEVLLFGARRREIQVQIDPDRLNAYGLSTTDVAAALRSQNLELPGGRLEQGNRELSVRTVGRLRNPDAFNDLVVATRGNSPIRIRDIGRVADTGADPDVGLDARRPAGPHRGHPQAERRQHRRTGRRHQGQDGRDPADAAAQRRGRPGSRRLGVHQGLARGHRGTPRARRDPRGDHRLHLPAQLPHDAHRGRRHPDVDHRGVRRHRRPRLHAQSDDDARPDADGRHRHRRRDRGAGEHLPVRRGEGDVAVPGGDRGHARDRTRGHGDHDGAARGIHPGGFSRRDRRTVHVIVRADVGRGDRDQPDRVVHADADAGGPMDQTGGRRRWRRQPRRRQRIAPGILSSHRPHLHRPAAMVDGASLARRDDVRPRRALDLSALPRLRNQFHAGRGRVPVPGLGAAPRRFEHRRHAVARRSHRARPASAPAGRAGRAGQRRSHWGRRRRQQLGERLRPSDADRRSRHLAAGADARRRGGWCSRIGRQP